jgi:trk system potassium uptake protein TrkH
VNELSQVYSTEEAFRHSYFQVASVLTTTGYSTTDFNLWPTVSLTVLIACMFIGGMAGSTSGGIKLSRIMIAIKGVGRNIRKLINPRYVSKTKFEDKPLEDTIINDVFAFITLYFIILVLCVLLLSFDPINGSVIQISSESSIGGYEVKHGFATNVTSAISAISNIGPGIEAIGPYSSFAFYSGFSKIILTQLFSKG